MAIIKCTYLTEICGNKDCRFCGQRCNFDVDDCPNYTDFYIIDGRLTFFEHCAHTESAEQSFITESSDWILDDTELGITDTFYDRDSITYLAINGEVIINRGEENNG